ncbi:MAG: hypothetical protein SFT91_02685 [Rickettsiaceae bacterium]|nr:hypothetical protein [Rickettsiaceae bacterium]
MLGFVGSKIRGLLKAIFPEKAVNTSLAIDQDVGYWRGNYNISEPNRTEVQRFKIILQKNKTLYEENLRATLDDELRNKSCENPIILPTPRNSESYNNTILSAELDHNFSIHNHHNIESFNNTSQNPALLNNYSIDYRLIQNLLLFVYVPLSLVAFGAMYFLRRPHKTKINRNTLQRDIDELNSDQEDQNEEGGVLSSFNTPLHLNDSEHAKVIMNVSNELIEELNNRKFTEKGFFKNIEPTILEHRVHTFMILASSQSKVKNIFAKYESKYQLSGGIAQFTLDYINLATKEELESAAECYKGALDERLRYFTPLELASIWDDIAFSKAIITRGLSIGMFKSKLYHCVKPAFIFNATKLITYFANEHDYETSIKKWPILLFLSISYCNEDCIKLYIDSDSVITNIPIKSKQYNSKHSLLGLILENTIISLTDYEKNQNLEHLQEKLNFFHNALDLIHKRKPYMLPQAFSSQSIKNLLDQISEKVKATIETMMNGQEIEDLEEATAKIALISNEVIEEAKMSANFSLHQLDSQSEAPSDMTAHSIISANLNEIGEVYKPGDFDRLIMGGVDDSDSEIF